MAYLESVHPSPPYGAEYAPLPSPPYGAEYAPLPSPLYSLDYTPLPSPLYSSSNHLPLAHLHRPKLEGLPLPEHQWEDCVRMNMCACVRSGGRMMSREDALCLGRHLQPVHLLNGLCDLRHHS